MKIRFKGDAIVIELPNLKGKKKYEDWGQGEALAALEESDGMDELITGYKALVVLTAYLKELKKHIEEEVHKYAGDTYKGVDIKKASAYTTKYDFQYSPHYKTIHDALKEVEDIQKGLAKKLATPGNDPEMVAALWLNPLTGEQVTFTAEDAAEIKTSKKFPFTLSI